MEKYQIRNIEELNSEVILQLINRYKMKEVPRMKRLRDYYKGNHDILKRSMSDPAKPNNRIVNNFCSLIVETVNGFFLGVPISYSSSEKDHMEKVQYIFDSNDEQSLNSRIGKDVSILGLAYELHYVDENVETKFSYLNPQETFMVFDNTIEAKPLAGIRFFEIENYTNQETEMVVEVYDKNYIYSYVQVDGKLNLKDEPQQHYYNQVPVVAYYNNDDILGDFEQILSLQDAYNIAVSDEMNSWEYFSDQFLVLTGVDAEGNEFQNMRENKVILLGENGKAEFLTKGDIKGVKEYKDHLKNDIHTFSYTQDISSETFGNTSGESLKYKLQPMSNAVSVKERFFKKGLEKRLQLITQFLNTKGGSYDANSITMNFTRNMPSNNETIAGVIEKLRGLISDKSLINLLPFIEDAAYEIELREKEKEGSLYEGLPSE